MIKSPFYNRRSFLRTTGLSVASLGALSLPVHAQTLEPTQTMRGGSNNYRPNAPVVDALGAGFVMSGLVRDASNGAPLPGIRIQIWAATVLGGEPDPVNHGSILTRADGTYALDMPQIVPNFGQPHGHLAYDDDAYQSVFLRPVMPSASDTTLNVDFVLAKA